jgi:hypothetical protein
MGTRSRRSVSANRVGCSVRKTEEEILVDVKELKVRRLRASRTSREGFVRFGFARGVGSGSRGGAGGGISHDEGAVHIVSGFGSVVFDAFFPVFAEEVEAEGIGFGVDDVEEAGFEVGELGGIELAFEDGVLDALSEIEAGFGDLAEASSSGGGGGGDVVGCDDVHG